MYLVCEKCGGYYELLSGESADDFDLMCECGGEIKCVESLHMGDKVNLEALRICPLCEKITPCNANYCQECGEKIESIEVIGDYESITKSEWSFIVCNECGYVYELLEDDNVADFEVCECGGKFKFYKDLDEYFDSKEYFETFLDSDKSSGKKIVSETINILKYTAKKPKNSYGDFYKGMRGGMMKEARGINGQLELYEHKIIIRRRGIKSLISQGWKGDKEILINQISSIQLKKADLITNGYIQFAFLGGTENKRGIYSATRDENTIMFTNSQENDFIEIKNLIESKIIESQRVNISTQDKESVITPAKKIKEAKELLDIGAITEEEFQEIKNKYLKQI